LGPRTIAWAADAAGRRLKRRQLTPFAFGGRLGNRRVDNAFDGFEWDERKSARTERKRGLSFDDAALVFKDPSRLDGEDLREDYGEIRNTAIGFVQGHGLLYIVWTPRGHLRRIISVRRAAPEERRTYENFRGG